MVNPYSPPSADAGKSASPTRFGWAHRSICTLIAAFCVVQFFGISMAAAHLMKTSGVPFGLVLGHLFIPFALCLGGVALLFRLRLSVYAFSAYLLLYFIKMGTNEGFGNLATIIVAILFLSYSLWLLKRGLLGGRPNNSFKPTPLRGSA